MAKHGKLNRVLMVSVLLAMLLIAGPGAALAQAPAPGTQFYVPKPNHGAIEQIAQLTAAGNKADAGLIGKMIDTPQAVWFTKGTPKSVQ